MPGRPRPRPPRRPRRSPRRTTRARAPRRRKPPPCRRSTSRNKPGPRWTLADLPHRIARLIRGAQMRPRLFLPTARQTNWLLVIGALALGEALYLRYLAIEYAPVALACQAGLAT